MSNPHLQAFARLARSLRANLLLAADGLMSRPRYGDAARLERFLNQTLWQLALLHGRGRFEHMTLREVFHSAIEAEMALAAEYAGERARLAAAGAEPPPEYAEAAQRYRLRARRLAEILEAAGHPGARGQVIGWQANRGVYAAPLTPALRAFIDARELMAQQWSDGILVIASDDDLAALRGLATEAAVLYRDGRALLHDHRHLSAYALDRELRQRLAHARSQASAGHGEPFLHHVNQLLLEEIVTLGGLRERLLPERPRLAAALPPLIQGSQQQLVRGLMSHRSWEPATKRGTHPVARVARADRVTRLHLERWIARWRSGDAAGLLERFEEVAGVGEPFDGTAHDAPPGR